jgi:P27 family predicted phage terminase small subunit
MPRPIPTALKKLRGNPGKRPLPQNEPQPARGAQMPRYLSPVAAEHWPLVAQQLDDAGVLTQMDTAALALYCEAFANWHLATVQVHKHGPVIKGKNGDPIQSPFLHVANKAWEQMLRILVEFGMTPSSRSRVQVVKSPKDEDHEFDEFITHTH